MNCLDYRRLLLAGEGETRDMQSHRAQCAACAELGREHAGFERELKAALEVPVPENFEERLVAVAASRRRRFLAAAAVGALAAGGGSFLWLGRQDEVAMACIDFVMKEEAKSIMMGSMPRAEAVAALAGTLPLERLERIGKVRHVNPCPFNGATAYHVVLAVPQGKVTLIVMPDGKLRTRASARHEGLYAAVIALPNGSVGIVGSDARVVDSIAGAVRA